MLHAAAQSYVPKCAATVRPPPSAMKRGRATLASPADTHCGESILFFVGAISEAVLEIDAEILDRLARQLVDDARVEAIGERAIDPDRVGQRRRIRRVVLQRAKCGTAQFLGGIGLEQMRAAVH